MLILRGQVANSQIVINMLKAGAYQLSLTITTLCLVTSHLKNPLKNSKRKGHRSSLTQARRGIHLYKFKIKFSLKALAQASWPTTSLSTITSVIKHNLCYCLITTSIDKEI